MKKRIYFLFFYFERRYKIMYSGYKKEEYVKNSKMRDFFDLIMGVSAGHDHDGTNSKAVSVGTVSDSAITNAKLATDVKIGSVAALTTTSKASIQGAINELDAEIGVISTLSTTAKSTIVEAINEVDAHADAAAASVAGLASLTGAETLTNKTLTSPIIDDTDAGLTLTSADQTHGSATATFPDLGDAADEVVMKDVSQTLTLKTLTTPVIASIYQDSGKTKLLTIPDTASDTLCAIAATQTLSGKTLTAPKIATTGSINDAGGDEYLKFVEATTPVTYIQITSGDTTVPPKVQGAGETNIDLHLLGSGTGKVVVSDGTDPTKVLNFNVAGATTGKYMSIVSSHTNDRVLTLPDATDTLIGKDTTDTLTLKTLTTPVIASLYQDAGKTQLMTVPNSASDTLCAIAATQTLTNKTLTSPAITSPVLTTPIIADGHENVTITSANQTDSGATATIPDFGDSADEFVMKDVVQSITGKTISMPNDAALTLGTTVATAATKITAEFDATTTGIGLINIGSTAVPQVLNVNPGSAVIAETINILHSAGAGDCDDCIASYKKIAVSGSGDSGLTIVGDAPRAYVGVTGGANNSVASAAYASQPWCKHEGTGAITAMSALSALVDVNTDNFTASTVNAGHFHVEGAATVTGQFDGAMIEVYPDVTSLDSGLAIVADGGSTVNSAIRIAGTFGCLMSLPNGAKIFTGTAANESAVYAEVGSVDAIGSIYFSTSGIYIQVANDGADADWNKVSSTHT